MEEDAEKRVRAKRSCDLDRLSDLQDCLLRKVLLNIRTKDVVKSSVLSTRWRNLWRNVPGLDLGCDDFPDCDAFVSFVDRFLRFNSLQLQEFKLKSESSKVNYDWEKDVTHLTRWINTVLNRGVKHLHVLEREWHVDKDLEMPLTVYTCKSLVSLKLREVTMANPKSVSLPCVRVMNIDSVSFTSDWAFEMLISGCRVLESLTVKRCPYGKVKVFRVCSQSLLRFTLVGLCDDVLEEQDLEVAIDAPRLEYLNLFKDDTDRFVINNLRSLVKVDMDTMFNLSYSKSLDPNDLSKRNIIRSFLGGISSVKDMGITSEPLEVIYDYSRCEPLPLFCNLSSLRVDFYGYKWEMLPIFLESCTNLKSLFLGFSKLPGNQRIRILPGRHCYLPTLESVEIMNPMIDDEAFLRMASYFLEKSTILKRFSFCLGGFSEEEDESDILKELLAIPRLSSSCRVFVL